MGFTGTYIPQETQSIQDQVIIPLGTLFSEEQDFGFDYIESKIYSAPRLDQLGLTIRKILGLNQ